MLGRLHVIPPLFSKVETEFGTAQDSARDLAEHFGVWLKRGVKKNLLCVFHSFGMCVFLGFLADSCLKSGKYHTGFAVDGAYSLGFGTVVSEKWRLSRFCQRSHSWNFGTFQSEHWSLSHGFAVGGACSLGFGMVRPGEPLSSSFLEAYKLDAERPFLQQDASGDSKV